MGFVKVADGELSALGTAKVVQQRGQKVQLQYFDLPNRECMTQWVDQSAVRSIELPPQTRVFVSSWDGRTWRVGRVLHSNGDAILVKLPNSAPANIEIDCLFVRWSAPIADPTSLLAQRITGTPLLADARSAFVQAVTTQRIASLGMGALLSSQIELNSYQFDVVRRVLQDPIQRYLLADEVGLGKTIEAGILVRQYFIDEPATARVLVIVPPALVEQWRQELRERFALGRDLDADMLSVIAIDDIASIRKVIGTVGMLVIDEAHHLSRAEGDMVALYEILTANAPRVARLLLLSATPALVDEAGFLRMVHLLDPVTFPLDDLEGFRRRIAGRQEVAETVAALTPGNMFILDRYLGRLEAAFPRDALLATHLNQLREILDRYPDKSDEDFLAALAALRNHLSETYRLHRRIVRNRRSSVPSWITPRRLGLQVWRYECGATARFANAVETMRLGVGNSNARNDGASLHNLLHAVLNPLDQDCWAKLVPQLQCLDQDLSPALGELERAREHVAVEQRRLERLGRGVNELLRDRCEVVVFCGCAAVADRVYARLAREFGKAAARHRPECGDEGDEVAEWRRFLSDDECRILVCDFQAEEGLNLHGGRKVVVNFDVAVSPNVIEQRLGRVDRYGAGDDIESFSLLCDDNLLEHAWLDALESGFGVFSQSIATLQYVIDDMLRTLPQGWLDQGEAFITKLTAGLRGDQGLVQRELRRIDQQDSLDALTIDASAAHFARLEEVDDEWRSFGDKVDAILFQTLQFQKRKAPFASRLVAHDHVFRVAYAYDQSRETLVTLPQFMECFFGEMDHEDAAFSARSPTSYAYTYRRPTVLTGEGRSKRLRLLRYGSGMVDGLTRFVERDDRGRVFAMWRYRPRATVDNHGGSDLCFRFDFIVEANLEEDSAESNGVAPRALRRIVDGVMVPQFVQIWLDDQLRLIAEPRAELLEPYRKWTEDDAGRDFNLDPARWERLAQQELYGAEHWSQLCTKAREVAEEQLRQLPFFHQHIKDALARMLDLHRLKRGQTEARIARLQGAALEAEQKEYVRQQAFDAKLESAVRHPSVGLDAIGAVFLANTNPFGSPL